MARGINLLAILIVMTTGVAAQDNPDYIKGKSYYDEERYREALFHFRKFIANDSSNAEVFRLRGNCYYDLNEADSAMMDYQTAIRLDPKMAAAYYNLGNIYEENGDLDLAITNMQTYVRLEPADGDGYARLSILKQKVSEPDSALYYGEEAHKLDPENLSSLLMLGWQYYQRGDHLAVLKLIEPEQKRFPEETNLMELEASTRFAMGDYETSITLADKLVTKEAEPLPYYSMKVKAELFRQTPSDRAIHSGSGLAFTHILSNATALLDTWVRDKTSVYFYSKLKERFINDIDNMTLDEVFMAYYGFSTDEGYAPYATPDKAVMSKKIEEQDFEGLQSLAEERLNKNPFDLSSREYLFIAQYSMHQPGFEKNLKRYLGLMEAILATGNGLTADSAFIVTAVNHEYDLLYYLGLETKKQALVNKNKHDYDILSTVDEHNTEKDIYFNIDKPFGSLRGTLTEPKPSKKGKKKKN